MRVADIGCGIGTVACWMAGQVGQAGHVVGVDASAAQLAVAREHANLAGLDNMTFIEGSAYDTGLERATFDLVCCRLLLIHLAAPAEAIREMCALLKPGGVLVCEDGVFSTFFSEPRCLAVERLVQFWHALWAKGGLDGDLGQKLPRLFLAAGLRAPEVSLNHVVYMRGEEKLLAELTFAESGPALIASGVATEAEVQAVIRELRALAEDETALLAFPCMVQVWGRKD
jgi:SAM-dependent methyltransferase